jgi:HK97 gp10 family phage protein
VVTIVSGIHGVPELRARLDAIGQDEDVDAVLEDAALELERRATQYAQFGGGFQTGRLKASIKHERLAIKTHAVVANTHYASFVEFGTGQRGSASPQPDGLPPDYVHGSVPGMAAQPYLRPALIEVRDLLQHPRTWGPALP